MLPLHLISLNNCFCSLLSFLVVEEHSLRVGDFGVNESKIVSEAFLAEGKGIMRAVAVGLLGSRAI
jgi:hypothetical protein